MFELAVALLKFLEPPIERMTSSYHDQRLAFADRQQLTTFRQDQDIHQDSAQPKQGILAAGLPLLQLLVFFCFGGETWQSNWG